MMTREELREQKENLLLTVDALIDEMVDAGYYNDDAVADALDRLSWALESDLGTDAWTIIVGRL